MDTKKVLLRYVPEEFFEDAQFLRRVIYELAKRDRKLSELLAVLHRDGGQTEISMGADKAFKAASKKASEMVQRYDDMKEDIQFFLEQSVIIEHRQDHKKMEALRKKYNFEW